MDIEVLQNLSFEKIWHRLLLVFLPNIVGTITQVSTNEHLCALTFDDGPHPEFTERLCRILEKYNARGTFFVIGKHATQHRKLLKRMAANGHAIGNHSMSHASFPHISTKECMKQILDCSEVIAEYDSKLLRPPYGNLTLLSRLNVWRCRYAVITWSLIAEDWLAYDTEFLTKKIVEKINPGDVILFHDRLFDYIKEDYRDRKVTLDAVENILKELSPTYKFVTVPALLNSGRPKYQYWSQEGDVSLLNKLKTESGDGRRYIQ